MRLTLALGLAVLASPLAAQTPTTPARYVVTDARIYTVDPEAPVAEALAVDGGRIAAVGTEAAVLASRADWPRLDLDGQTVVPGLIDAHGHLMGLGESLLRADLVGAATKAEALTRVAAFARTLPDGEWVLGRGWDQNDWTDADGAFPTAADLDAVVSDRPVWLARIDGHAAWANTAALRAAGLDPDAPAPPDPPGGQILRDAQGRPTGVFVDAASALVDRVVPPPTDEAQDLALQKALGETARYGLTGMHDAGAGLGTIDRYARFIDAGRFPLRVYAMITPAGLDTFCATRPVPFVHPSGRLRVRSIKLFADGALGSRGAALLAPYADDVHNTGLLFEDEAALRQIVGRAFDCGLQVNTHAIGDRANRTVLDAYAAALADHPDAPGRNRIEHAQILALRDIPRFAELGVIASVQPTHATSDMPWAGDRLGADRLRGAYAWRRLIDAGARLALGSDFPVERVDPLLGFYAAVTRQDADHSPAGGWYGNQVLTREEALRGFTLDAAYAAFMEDEVGSLEVGKRADFVVLSQDLMHVPPEQLLDTRVRATYLDGVPVYVAN